MKQLQATFQRKLASSSSFLLSKNRKNEATISRASPPRGIDEPAFSCPAPLNDLKVAGPELPSKDMGCLGSKDRLSKEDMDFLKSHTRYDESTIKEWYKGFKQDCPNGKLTPAKFVDMYKMFFPSGNAEEFCDHVFRTFDMDKNGYIDFKEFLLAIDVTSSGTPEEKLKWAFRMYDVDGNGVIDIQEMTKIVQAIYDMLGACSSNKPADSAEERAKNIFAKMDENNDGQLTQDEFLKGCLQDEELSKMLAP